VAGGERWYCWAAEDEEGSENEKVELNISIIQRDSCCGTCVPPALSGHRHLVIGGGERRAGCRGAREDIAGQLRILLSTCGPPGLSGNPLHAIG
jgi:hypothetical protein